MTADPVDLERAGLRLDIDDSSPAGSVATVTLSRPERRNAMTPAMWRGLARIGDSLPPEVRVVVLRGDGPSFSAGIDVRLFSPPGGDGTDGIPAEDRLPDPSGPGFEDWIAECQRGYLWLRRPGIVSIAAVHGHAIGGGFQLALACDLRVLADDAKLCMKEAALGLVPDLTGTKPLVDIVGLPRALELCLTARTVGAAEARELRLAESVVPPAELDATVSDLAAALLATDAATARAVKALLARAAGRTIEEQAEAERLTQGDLQRSRLPAAGGGFAQG
jgi:enoyl-CoA hydratase/carnithine racemase